MERKGNTNSLPQSWDTRHHEAKAKRGSPCRLPRKSNKPAVASLPGASDSEHPHWLHDAFPSKDLKFPKVVGTGLNVP